MYPGQGFFFTLVVLPHWQPSTWGSSCKSEKTQSRNPGFFWWFFSKMLQKEAFVRATGPKKIQILTRFHTKQKTLILAPVPFRVSQQVRKQHWINKIYKMYQSSLANSMFANIKIHSMWFEKSLSFFFLFLAQMVSEVISWA